MAKHLVICGHGQGWYSYDPGAVNREQGYNEAEKVREFVELMRTYSGEYVDYITDYNVYDYQNIDHVGKNYTTITELHFNAFNKQARGSEILIYEGYEADNLDKQLLSILGEKFINRGIKKVEWLYNANVCASLGYNYRLVEICFLDNNADMEIYHANASYLAKKFVQAIVGGAAVENSLKKNFHFVEKGDTLSAIARKYNTTWQSLAAKNKLANPNYLEVGQKIEI